MNGNLAGPEVAIWAAGIAVGLDMGFVMRSQQLRIDAQAREHATRERQAVLEERHRIGREVHDLVAHSLSVTMLHLTAARREVDDAAEHGDAAHLEDARSALRDAERVGRQAMADIRSTVGFLGEDHEPLTLPPPASRTCPACWRTSGRRPRRGVRRPRRSRPGPGHHRARPLPHRAGVARQRRQARARVPGPGPARRLARPRRADGDQRAPLGAYAATPAAPASPAWPSGRPSSAPTSAPGRSTGPGWSGWSCPAATSTTDGHVCPLPRLTAPFRRAAPGPA